MNQNGSSAGGARRLRYSVTRSMSLVALSGGTSLSSFTPPTCRNSCMRDARLSQIHSQRGAIIKMDGNFYPC